jgi:hypothetical protein
MRTIINFTPTQELLNNFDKKLLKLDFEPTPKNINTYDEILSFYELSSIMKLRLKWEKQGIELVFNEDGTDIIIDNEKELLINKKTQNQLNKDITKYFNDLNKNTKAFNNYINKYKKTAGKSKKSKKSKIKE